MKIAFDAKRALNNGTGLGNHARILLNAMIRDYPENEYLLFSPTSREAFFDQMRGPFALHFPSSVFSRSVHSWWRTYGMTEELLSNMVDIYHGLSNELPMNIHRSGIRCVVTIHDLIFLKHTGQYPWADRQIYSIKTRYAARHAHKIIAVSEETKKDLVERYKVPEQKIAVIYPSIDPVFSDKKNEEEKVVVRKKYKLPASFILNVSSFYPRKNQLKLITAFDSIKDKIVQDLVLIGSTGSILEEIKKLIALKRLQSRVHIITTVTNEDMPAVYQLATVFVFPSLFEGFGAPVLEALFSGIPVIATAGGAIAEAAGSDALFIDPNEVEDIAAKILLAIKDPVLRSRMIEKGEEHVLHMNDKTFATKTIEVYKDILGF